MKLRKALISNFRSIDNLEIDTPNSFALVGPNNVGKSNILQALNIILNRYYPTYFSIKPEDFYKKDFSKPIKIVLRFSDLTDDERTYFRARSRGYMRQRGGEPTMYNYSENLNICLELPYDEEGKFYYVGDDFAPLRFSSGQEIVIRSEARKFFPKFLFIPGLRDSDRYFSDSTKYEWGKILDTLRRKIDQNNELKDAVEKLRENILLDEELSTLNDEIKSGILEFLSDEHKAINLSILPIDPGDILRSVKLILDDGFESGLEYKGDGIKSLAVIALLLLATKHDRNLILGLEEPELFLHPSALFILNEAIQRRGTNNQIVYSSHSPFLINVTKPKNIVRVFKTNKGTKVAQLPNGSHWLTVIGEEEIERDIDAQRNLLFFARAVILVEGPTEYLSLPTFASKLGIDLSKKGIVLIEVNGKPNLSRYSSYLNDFKIPHIIVYDKDVDAESLNQNIENSAASSKFVMNIDFERMFVDQLGVSKLNDLLSIAYGDTFQQYKNDYRIRNLSEEEKIRKFLLKSKPFAVKNISQSVDREYIPDRIKEIIRGAVVLVE